MSGESVDVNRTFHFEAVRTSNQVPKRRAMDVEFDEDDNIDEEAHNQALQTAKDDFLVPGTGLLEFSNGLPSPPPKKQKTKLSEVEQQLKKAEAAQRRRIQSKKAAREAEGYPPPREKCAGPNCTNAYKYRDLMSKLPLCIASIVTTQYMKRCSLQLPADIIAVLPRSQKEIDGCLCCNLVLPQRQHD
ncbi:hypothetical protein NC653_025503 [Populus alba x Populus x berolinensis]|uniref:Uncharacterized protein n=1 Tax=Populus alba x Populus x berolinensis TaxID=444605 RepID=A0AAD6Q830_9ROSI|nr:hypothetical protein NC653_025503 [Populus alba x Populus x berolinensis]